MPNDLVKMENTVFLSGKENSGVGLTIYKKGEEPLVDIRHYVSTPTYVGPTKKGVRLNLNDFNTLMKFLVQAQFKLNNP